MDTDPYAKKAHPKWVGAIPNTDRAQAFANILVMCAAQALAKGSATAMLAVTNARWLLLYTAVDNGAYFVYKAARRDVMNFLPGPLSIALPMSLFARFFVEKTLTDFTSW
jgi:hypothetical protein